MDTRPVKVLLCLWRARPVRTKSCARKAGGASLDVSKMLQNLVRRVLHGESMRLDLLDDAGGRSSALQSGRGRRLHGLGGSGRALAGRCAAA